MVADLLHIIRSGMLFELQEWIMHGKPLLPCGKRTPAIVEAAQTGFHSMVRVLLDAQDWEEEQLAQATVCAAIAGRSETVMLLLSHRPSVASWLDCSILSNCLSHELWLSAIRAGLPLRGPDGFGEILKYTFARPLLRIFKECHKDHPDLLSEGSLALYDAVERGSARRVALLIWAGVDPLLPYEDPDEYGDSESAWHFAPAVIEAISMGRVDMLKMMKLRPSDEQWWRIVKDGSTFANPEALAYVLALKSNARGVLATKMEEHGKLLVNACHGLWRTRRHYSPERAREKAAQVTSLLRLLLDHGVRLRSTHAESIPELRRIIYDATDEQAAATVAILESVNDPEHTAALKTLTDRPKFRTLLRRWQPRLHRELFP